MAGNADAAPGQAAESGVGNSVENSDGFSQKRLPKASLPPPRPKSRNGWLRGELKEAGSPSQIFDRAYDVYAYTGHKAKTFRIPAQPNLKPVTPSRCVQLARTRFGLRLHLLFVGQ